MKRDSSLQGVSDVSSGHNVPCSAVGSIYAIRHDVHGSREMIAVDVDPTPYGKIAGRKREFGLLEVSFQM